MDESCGRFRRYLLGFRLVTSAELHSGLVIVFIVARGRAICRPPFIAASATLNHFASPRTNEKWRSADSIDTDTLAAPSSPPSYRHFLPRMEEGGRERGSGRIIVSDDSCPFRCPRIEMVVNLGNKAYWKCIGQRIGGREL